MRKLNLRILHFVTVFTFVLTAQQGFSAENFKGGIWQTIVDGQPGEGAPFYRFVFNESGSVKITKQCGGEDNIIEEKIWLQDGETLYIKSSEGEYSESLEPGKIVIKVDPRYFRPTEVDLLIGDPTKAKEKLGWEPKYSFDDLVKEMVESDLKLMKKDRFLTDAGYDIKNYFE